MLLMILDVLRWDFLELIQKWSYMNNLLHITPACLKDPHLQAPFLGSLPRLDPNETNELSMANSRFNIRWLGHFRFGKQ